MINTHSKGLHPLSASAGVLYIKVPSSKGNIFVHENKNPFQKSFPWQAFGAASKLRGQTASQIPVEVISKVEDMVEDIENAGAKMDWINKVIGRF